MRARDVMTHNPITVGVDVPVREAAARLSEHAITSMPVVDDDGQVIGIVSEIDLLRNRMPHDPRSSVRMQADPPDPPRSVGDVMSDTVVCLPDAADAADLAEAMVENHLRAIPILAGGDLVGIVSRRDLLRTLLRDDTAIRAEAIERLTECIADAQHFNVDVNDGVITVSGHFGDDRDQRLIQSVLRTVPGTVRVHVHPTRFAL
jgi:CBS domain-containing protein